MEPIKSNSSTIFFSNDCYEKINLLLQDEIYSKIFIIVDNNTHEFCYPYFCSQLKTNLTIDIIEIKDGEMHKNIETCQGVWNVLSELNADRKCLIINLGGGVVTDLGGFVSSTFKRGVDFVNIPTSLLAMVDASVGGKTGIDLGGLKNQIGIFNNPILVAIDPYFLKTLPQNEMRSGLAEMLKHGLILDVSYFEKLSDLSKLTLLNLEELIYHSVLLKNNIIEIDPLENNVRKKLNFGHTLGHAIETYFLNNEFKKTLLHGEAIAVGMILASFISTKKSGLCLDKCNKIKCVILDLFPKINFTKNDIETILSFAIHDKKNTFGEINFVLLQDIGDAIIDQKVEKHIILDAFKYYYE